MNFPDFPDHCTDELRNTFLQQGYLAYENALTAEEICQATESISDLLKTYAFDESKATVTLPKAGDTSVYGGCHWNATESRFMFQTEPGYEPDPANPDDLEPHVRKLAWFSELTPTFVHISLEHPKIKPFLATLLGDDPVYYQSMALLKPPGGVEKPWHQDNAYFRVEDPQRMLGIWIALDEATVENGCMHVWPGAHHRGPMKHHHDSTDCTILSDRMAELEMLPIPLKPGGILIFHSNLPHYTPPNRSDHRRRALQFHYRAASNALVSDEDYFKVFVEADGSPASCVAARQENF
jgi:phytanoyl-CoA hydroxylase